jgi:hypothetical protein
MKLTATRVSTRTNHWHRTQQLQRLDQSFFASIVAANVDNDSWGLAQSHLFSNDPATTVVIVSLSDHHLNQRTCLPVLQGNIEIPVLLAYANEPPFFFYSLCDICERTTAFCNDPMDKNTGT